MLVNLMMDCFIGVVIDFVVYVCVVNVLVELNEECKVVVIIFVNWLFFNNVLLVFCMCIVNLLNKMRVFDLYEVMVLMVEMCFSFVGIFLMIFIVISYEFKLDVENWMICVFCGGELR